MNEKSLLVRHGELLAEISALRGENILLKRRIELLTQGPPATENRITECDEHAGCYKTKRYWQ